MDNMGIMQISTLCLFLYASQLNGLNDVNFGTNLSTIAYSYCPNNRFCKSGLESPPPDAQSCCGQCSCEADCYIGQRCCPDADIEQTSNVRLACKTMDKHFDAHRDIWHKFGKKAKSYFVINYCPVEFENDDVIQGCMVPREIREHVFVTDPLTAIIYKNFQCAICNGVQNYEFWELGITCFFTNSFFSSLEDETAIMEGCRFNSVPPTLSLGLVDKWRCDPSAAVTCNVTGRWDVYDRVLVEACASYSIPYSAPNYNPMSQSVTGSKPYGNVYCFLCNTGTSDYSADVPCLSLVDTDVKDTFGIPFEAMLDFTSFDRAHSPEEQDAVCKVNQIMNPITDTCADMLCPFGQVPFHGNCVSTMKATNLTFTGIFEFEFPASPSNANSTSGDQPDEAGYDALVLTIQNLLARRRCVYCWIVVYANVFGIHVRRTETCSNEFLFKIFRHLTTVSVVRGADGRIEFPVKIWISSRYSFVSEPGRTNIKYEVIIRRVRNRPCVHAANLSPKFYCKRIVFSTFDLVGNGMNNDSIASILEVSEPSEYINGSASNYVICMDDLVRITNKGSQIGSITIVIIIVILFFLPG